MGEIIGLVAVVCIFGWPLIAVMTHHQRKMAEIKYRSGDVDGSVTLQLQEIKQELASLRDTTTRFDMSFDTALQRLESRMNTMEQRVGSIEGSSQKVLPQ